MSEKINLKISFDAIFIDGKDYIFIPRSEFEIVSADKEILILRRIYEKAEK